MFQSGHVAAARCLLAASPPLHTILKKKVKSTNIYKITFFKIAHSCKWFRSAADSCSHLQPLADTCPTWLQQQAASGCKNRLQVVASGCFFENQNDARLLAFCNLEKKENLQTHFFPPQDGT